MKIFLIVILIFPLTTFGRFKEVKITNNMLITSSVKIITGSYLMNGSDSLQEPVITIKGDNITVDFNGAELKGSSNKEWPNEFYGTAIIIKGGKNIVVKNANIHGYKIAVIGTNVENLDIQNCNFSYNYRQKLHSSRLEEDVSDWMSYHHNENDEWLRYGAGIYLRNCNKINIHNNIIMGGQCGLMITNCNDGLVYNNNFSFNSGIGIGMYRSSRNKILHNQLDFNVRGYSDGIFNRGQDSAGLLVFEQCSNNTFAYNSVTHSGDGFFLWAGQYTMDTGEGGCNDNLIYKNDFSYAPTNGVEVTFSRNNIIKNIIKECDNGIWGGYSYHSNIINNKIFCNNTGIAIEHGQNNSIVSNNFYGDKVAIKLWARKEQPKDWIYAQKRNTQSKQYKIQNNTFKKNNIALQVILTDSINLSSNHFDSVLTKYKFDSTVTNVDSSVKSRGELPGIPHYSLNGIVLKNSPASDHPGRKEIRITQWGPYDYQYPIVWLTKVDSNGKMHFDILGPKGKWTIKNSKGVKSISASKGSFPAHITAQATSDNIEINAEYKGPSFTNRFGAKEAANQPYLFSFRQFDPQIIWDIKWYSWDEEHNPNKNYEKFQKIFSNKPLKTEISNKLDYTWWGKIGQDLPADSFATVATGFVQLPKGKYEIGVTADDLVKVFIDGKPVINFWDASKYVYDEDAHHSAIINLDGNRHAIRVEHVENAGYATLIFTLKPL